MANKQSAWLSAFQKGSKQLQSRLMQMHKNNPEFQEFVRKHGFGGNLSAKQSEKQKKSSVVTVPPADQAKPEMKKGPADREAMIKQAAEKLRQRRQAAANRVAFGGELGGGFVMPHSSFRTYREHLEEQKKKLDKMGFPIMPKVQQLPPPKGGHPVPKGYERVKDPWGFNVLRKIRTEDVAYLDGYVATHRGGWVARRNGKQIGPVVSTKEIAQKYIKQTKKGIAAKVLDKLTALKPRLAAESRENRERIRSYDSAIVVSKTGRMPKMTIDPKSKLNKLRQMARMGLRKVLATEYTEMSSKEALNELKKATLASYLQKAPSRIRSGTSLAGKFADDKYYHMGKANKHHPNMVTPGFEKDPEKLAHHEKHMQAASDLEDTFKRQAANRIKGIQRAGRLMAKEEVEPINEKNTESHPDLWNTHELRHESGKVLKKGDVVKGFRDDEHFKVHGFELPHHSGSTGRVYVHAVTPKGRKIPGSGYGMDGKDPQSFFPGVINAKIVAKKGVKEETSPIVEKALAIYKSKRQPVVEQKQEAAAEPVVEEKVTEEKPKIDYRQVREAIIRRKK